MPLPPTPITVHGGCNCGALRYKIEIPELEKRILHPALPEEARQDPTACRFPFATTCHCNNCREATAGLFLAGICAPAEMVWVSSLSRSSEQAKEAAARKFQGKTFGNEARFSEREATGKLSERTRDDTNRPPYRPGMEMMLPSPESEDTFLNFYHSSNARTRAFCGRCGTSIVYNIWPTPPGFFDMLDISMGTLDREDLEKWEIDTQLWWSYGVEWIQKLTTGSDVPRYKTFKPLGAEQIHD